ncbi:hypothetical protein FQR65_LT01819 [Abscondita terminalis]|nr:hypothetical protein FQR65_LT01819 [Abscondita terminalis]
MVTGACNQCYSCVGTPLPVLHIPSVTPEIKTVGPACSDPVRINELDDFKVQCNSSCMKIDIDVALCSCYQCYSCAGAPVDMPTIPNMPKEIKTVSRSCADPIKTSDLQNALIECNDGISTCTKIEIKVADGETLECFSCTSQGNDLCGEDFDAKVVAPQACRPNEDVCIKAASTVLGVTLITRTCGIKDTCSMFDECDYCENDNCNLSHRMRPNEAVFTLIGVVLVKLMF